MANSLIMLNNSIFPFPIANLAVNNSKCSMFKAFSSSCQNSHQNFHQNSAAIFFANKKWLYLKAHDNYYPECLKNSDGKIKWFHIMSSSVRNFWSAQCMTLPNSGFTIGYVISAMIMSRIPRKVQFISSGLFLAVANATLGFSLNQEVLISYTII